MHKISKRINHECVLSEIHNVIQLKTVIQKYKSPSYEKHVIFASGLTETEQVIAFCYTITL